MEGFKGFDHTGSDWQSNMTLLGNGTGLLQSANSGNSTFMVINEFKFLAARSIRNSTIILATFNTISAFATAIGIIIDCKMAAKRSGTGGKGKFNILTCIGSSETYPFILSLGITIQGIVFAVAQSRGLDGLFMPNCALISQIMWPAIFIVPFIQLVFGLEVTIRGLKSQPFHPRGKWDVVICLAAIGLMLLATGLVGIFIRAPNFCFASLFWFVARWATGAFVVMLIIAVVLLLCNIVIFLRLTRYSTIENSERVAASRMVYYLSLAIVSNALMVPFFLDLTFTSPFNDDDNSGLQLSMIASVVANVSGLMTGGLYLFLRSSTISTINPREKLSDVERTKLKYNIRLRGPYDPDFNGQILHPVPGPRTLSKTESQESLVSLEKGNTMEWEAANLGARDSQQYMLYDLDPLRSNAVKEMPRAPEPAEVSSTPAMQGLGRRPSTSYSLFPSKNQPRAESVALLPSTTYSPNSNGVEPKSSFADMNNTLRPPPPLAFSGGRHRRDSSLASSATVQIGLRLSNMGEIPPMASTTAPEPETVHNLDCPNRIAASNQHRPSPLARAQHAESISPPPQAQSFATPGIALGSPTPEMMKTLPPVPAIHSQWTQQETKETLSPRAYTPSSPTNGGKGRITSPKGVGFNMPQRANTTPVENPDVPAPLRTRGNSNPTEKRREDWI